MSSRYILDEADVIVVDRPTTETFHLQGQHDQQAHAGGRGSSIGEDVSLDDLDGEFVEAPAAEIVERFKLYDGDADYETTSGARLYRAEDDRYVTLEEDDSGVYLNVHSDLYDVDVDVSDLEARIEESWREDVSRSIVYHGTRDGETAESIRANGLQIMNETRGLNNRWVGPAVYTSTEPELAGSYGQLFEVDLPRAIADGVIDPDSLSREPGFNEADAMQAVASSFDDYSFDAYGQFYGSGEDPQTVVISAAIPPEYLKFDEDGSGAFSIQVFHLKGTDSDHDQSSHAKKNAAGQTITDVGKTIPEDRSADAVLDEWMAPPEEFAAARALAAEKARNVPKPTAAQIAKNQAMLAKSKRPGGWGRGNSFTRRARGQALFEEFGGTPGGYCPCGHCGIKVSPRGEGGFAAMTQDKILTAAEGGTYGTVSKGFPNLIPACGGCNASRNQASFDVRPAWEQEELPGLAASAGVTQSEEFVAAEATGKPVGWDTWLDVEVGEGTVSGEYITRIVDVWFGPYTQHLIGGETCDPATIRILRDEFGADVWHPMTVTDPASIVQLHLQGQHDQKDHGRRAGVVEEPPPEGRYDLWRFGGFSYGTTAAAASLTGVDGYDDTGFDEGHMDYAQGMLSDINSAPVSSDPLYSGHGVNPRYNNASVGDVLEFPLLATSTDTALAEWYAQSAVPEFELRGDPRGRKDLMNIWEAIPPEGKADVKGHVAKDAADFTPPNLIVFESSRSIATGGDERVVSGRYEVTAVGPGPEVDGVVRWEGDGTSLDQLKTQRANQVTVKYIEPLEVNITASAAETFHMRGRHNQQAHAGGALPDVPFSDVKIAYRPRHPDGKADPGEVVWAQVPFEERDGRAKDRPVLIIGRTKDGENLVGVQLTSKPGRDRVSVGTGGWDRQGRESYMDTTRFIQVDDANYRREGAYMKKPVFQAIADVLTDRQNAPDVDLSVEQFHMAGQHNQQSHAGRGATGASIAGSVVARVEAGESITVSPSEVADVVAQFADQEGPMDLAAIDVEGYPNLFSSARANMTAREDMPQIPRAHLQQFREQLEAEGIAVEEVQLNATELSATQRQLDAVKVAGVADAIRNGEFKAGHRIWVSHDNRVLDGHHRWAAAAVVELEGHPTSAPLDGYRVDMDMDALLVKARRYNEEHGVDARTYRAHMEALGLNPGQHFHLQGQHDQQSHAGDGASTPVDDYQGGHRPSETGPRIHDLLESEMTDGLDVYQNPHFFTGYAKAELDETMAQLRRVQGDPEANVTIYRAAPEGATINEGDWVSLSKKYAELHAASNLPDGVTAAVVEMDVPAKTVRWAVDDLMEYGYFPDLGEKRIFSEDDLAVETFHLQGQHDQQSHAGGGSASPLRGKGRGGWVDREDLVGLVGEPDGDTLLAVDSYISGGHESMNPALRAGGPLDSDDTQLVEELDAAMQSSQGMARDVVLYRGLMTNGMKGLAVGDVVEDRAFLSVSATEGVAGMFGMEGYMEITVPEGTKGVLGEETMDEIILERGLRYQVDEVDEGTYFKVSVIS